MGETFHWLVVCSHCQQPEHVMYLWNEQEQYPGAPTTLSEGSSLEQSLWVLEDALWPSEEQQDPCRRAGDGCTDLCVSSSFVSLLAEDLECGWAPEEALCPGPHDGAGDWGDSPEVPIQASAHPRRHRSQEAAAAELLSHGRKTFSHPQTISPLLLWLLNRLISIEIC